jgi:hypothetical protein
MNPSSQQHRFNTVAKTVHASFSKAAAGEAPQSCSFLAAAGDECFEGGNKQQGCQRKKQ